MVNNLCFLNATRGNYFMTELLGAIAAAAERRGINVTTGEDVFPEDATDTAFVVIPHEFFELAPEGGRSTPLHLARTIGLCVEQPGTQWFELTCAYAARLGAMLATHKGSCRELRRRGISATHFRLGYVPEWDAWGRDDVSRPIEVLYLGSADDRRSQLLASYAESLWTRRQRIVLARPEPKRGPGPSFIVGREKHELLRSSQILLNLHRAQTSGLEWVRVIEAICNGAVVVSEHSGDCAPLVPGEHFISGRSSDLGQLADLLLDDGERLDELRKSAYDLLRSDASIEHSVDRLLAVADTLPDSSTSAQHAPSSAIHAGTHHEAELVDRVAAAVGAELRPMRAALKGLTIEVLQTRRTLARLEHAPSNEGQLKPLVAAETEAYSHVNARVSVAISVHNYEREIVDALNSVAASEHDSFEVLILDDASTDSSAVVVADYLEARPWLPARLLRHRSNQGLGATRNALIAEARGELVFILDADNTIYPTALARHEAALIADPGASLAYSLSVVEVDGEPTGLLNAHAWHPRWIRSENYIDAMVMLRRDRLLEAGGYCEDPRLTGHEDYDLWCRLADAGQYGIHVPEILTTYRRRSHGMLQALTNIDDTVSRSLIMARAPRLFDAEFAQAPYLAVGLRA